MRGAGPAVSTAFRLGEETGRGVCWGLQRRAAVVQPERSSGVAFSALKSGTMRLVGWLVSPLIFSYVLLIHLSPEGFFSAPPLPIQALGAALGAPQFSLPVPSEGMQSEYRPTDLSM